MKSAPKYIIMIYSDKSDPWAYGTFASKQDAVNILSKLKKSWNDIEWYHYESHIIELKEINMRSK